MGGEYEYDDGWRICEACHEGYTWWDEQPACNGWHEAADMCLCDECYAKAESSKTP